MKKEPTQHFIGGDIMGRLCGYCHFECRYKGDEDVCPLTKIDNQLAECWDVDCEYNEDCDNCISYQEG